MEQITDLSKFIKLKIFRNKDKILRIGKEIYDIKVQNPKMSWRMIARNVKGIKNHITAKKYYYIYLKITGKKCVIIENNILRKRQNIYEGSLLNIKKQKNWTDEKSEYERQIKTIDLKYPKDKIGCMKCSLKSNHLEKHHIYKKAYGGKELISLCSICHKFIPQSKDWDLNAKLFNSYVGTQRSIHMDYFELGGLIERHRIYYNEYDMEKLDKIYKILEEKYFYFIHIWKETYGENLIDILKNNNY